MDTGHSTPSRWAVWLEQRSRWVILAAIVATALLAVPFLTMTPTETASQEPGGAVFDARDAVDERFVSSVYSTFVITESRSGDILTAQSLHELLRHTDALRTDPEIGPALFSYFDAETATDVVGVATIADLVDRNIPGGLATATDAEVKAVVAELIDELGADAGQLGLSVESRFDEAVGGWIAPAVSYTVLSDNDVLGFGNLQIALGGDTASEEYARDVIEVLRGEGSTNQTWGVAIDVNLTSAEQGEAAGPFIGFTILAVLLVVGLTFRSYWVLALTGGALGALIIWLKGISNLIGLKDDLILTLIVPIAMISFGVDFAFHAVGRYKEERQLAMAPRRAFSVGMSAVIGALVLALASDSAAFLSNAASGIESIVQFGVGAAIALAAAFLLLGVVTPLAVAEIEAKIGTPRPGRSRAAWRVTASLFAGLLAMASVLLMVYVLPAAGVAALGVYVVALLVVPYFVAKPHTAEPEALGHGGVGRASRATGRAVAAIARRRVVVLPLAAVITVGAAVLALQVETEFDVKDFFAADTDFVVSLDKLDQHIGERGGEPAQIYIAAPLSQPEALDRVAGFADDVRALDSEEFARDDDGVRVDGGILAVVDDVWASPAAQAAFVATTGIELTDLDGNGIPDTEEQITALVALSREAGIPFDQTRLVQTPDEVRTSVWIGDDGAELATVFELGLVNSRSQASISTARAELEPLLEDLRSDLAEFGEVVVVEVTGSPIVRQASLDAISRALSVSLPIAVVLCFLIAAAFMRSVRLAAVVIVPILMTVAWLYAFMEVFGFTINLVTATIGAVSIGIGIDFAIHYTMRFREETAQASPDEAVRISGEGTGTALIASALSSALGFAILAFAPMPLFASYGLLTAVMIGMALVASLVVLPGLLLAVTRPGQDPDATLTLPERQPAGVS